MISRCFIGFTCLPQRLNVWRASFWLTNRNLDFLAHKWNRSWMVIWRLKKINFWNNESLLYWWSAWMDWIISLVPANQKDFPNLQSHAKWVNNSIRKRIFEFERMAAAQPTLEIGNWVSIQFRSIFDPLSERTKLWRIIYENCHSPMFLFWVNGRFVIGSNEYPWTAAETCRQFWER